MISDIPAGDGKMANLFLQCTFLLEEESPLKAGKSEIKKTDREIDRYIDIVVVNKFYVRKISTVT